MPSDRRLSSPAWALLLAAAGGVGAALWLLPTPPGNPPPPGIAPAPGAPAVTPAARDGAREDNLLALAADAAARAELAARLKERLNRAGVRPDEAVLAFKDAEAYRRFLERARAAGLDIVGRLESFHAVRVRVGDYAALVGELAGNAADYASIGANPVFSVSTPLVDERAARAAAPV